MVIGVVELVVVVATLGEVVDDNLTKLVVVMESITIGSLRNNLIVWMRKGTSILFRTILLAAKFKPIIQILFLLLPLLHLLPLLLSLVQAPLSQIQVSGTSVAPESQSVLTGVPSSVVPLTPWSVSMALVTPCPTSHGSTIATQMESGPNTLLCQLMSNASAQFPAPTAPSQANDTVTTTFNGGHYQIRHMNYAYQYTQHVVHTEYQGALVDSGANGGMGGSDMRVLATVPHAFVDITGIGGKVLQCLPIIQGASIVHMVDEGPVILIMSQYAHKPDSKSIHSKSQIEHFGGVVHDSAKSMGGQQLVVTHKGYTIPFHVCNGLYYMDMSPAKDEDMEHYPHVFITADAPWNPDVVDEEFFFDTTNAITGIPGVQQCQDAHEVLDLFPAAISPISSPSDTPITQPRFASILHSLSFPPQTLCCCLPDLDALLLNFVGWGKSIFAKP